MAEPNKSVLLVEDHQANVLITTMFLEELGYNIDVAFNGWDAIEKFEASRFGLVILDLQLPQIDGFEVARRIRFKEKTDNLPPTPILAVTGNATEDDKILCLREGMNDYLSKPYRLPELEKKLRALCPV
jgi:CheY-like chemotaxis protein